MDRDVECLGCGAPTSGAARCGAPACSGSRDYPDHPRGCPCSGCYHSNVTEGAGVRERRRIRSVVEAMLNENDMNWTMGQSMAGAEHVLYERIADKVLRKVLAAIDDESSTDSVGPASPGESSKKTT